MKVVHLTSTLNGGAGIACKRLNEALVQQGVNSQIITLSDLAKNPFTYLLYRLLKKFPLPINNFLKAKLQERKLDGKYEIFSSPFSLFRLENHKEIQEADIINLHWVGEMINYPTFFKNVKKPIVWTLHDLNPIMGGFHYREDKILNPQFENLEAKYSQIKRDIYNKNNIHFIALNIWMENEIREYGYQSVHIIQNSINHEAFQGDNKKNITDLDQYRDFKKVMFVSENVSNRRKGFKLLKNALEKITDGKILLITVGQSSTKIKTNLPIIEFGKVADSSILSFLFQQSDIFVLPSREDNLPNVVVESLVNGCPVVAYNIGGLPDMISDFKNGILAQPFSEMELLKAIKLSLNFDFDRNNIAKEARIKYSPELQARNYTALYKKILSYEN